MCAGHAGGGVVPVIGVGWNGDRGSCRSAARCALCDGFESLQNQPMVAILRQCGIQIEEIEGGKIEMSKIRSSCNRSLRDIRLRPRQALAGCMHGVGDQFWQTAFNLRHAFSIQLRNFQISTERICCGVNRLQPIIYPDLEGHIPKWRAPAQSREGKTWWSQYVTGTTSLHRLCPRSC